MVSKDVLVDAAVDPAYDDALAIAGVNDFAELVVGLRQINSVIS